MSKTDVKAQKKQSLYIVVGDDETEKKSGAFKRTGKFRRIDSLDQLQDEVNDLPAEEIDHVAVVVDKRYDDQLDRVYEIVQNSIQKDQPYKRVLLV